MKYINKPVKVTVAFQTSGKFEPVKFDLYERSIMVDRILETREDNFAGNKRIVFVCEHREKYKYELKYEVDSKIWYLFA